MARLSALLTGRLNPQEVPLVLIYFRGLDDPRAIARPEEVIQTLCRVFTVIYLKQIMFLRCIVLKPFCIVIIIIIIIISSSSSIHRQSI